MTNALKNQLMLVVDESVRSHFAAQRYPGLITNDTAGAMWCGVLVSQLMFKTGWTGDRLRYQLKAMVAEGSLVEYQVHRGAHRSYWPRGLAEKLKKEQAA